MKFTIAAKRSCDDFNYLTSTSAGSTFTIFLTMLVDAFGLTLFFYTIYLERIKSFESLADIGELVTIVAACILSFVIAFCGHKLTISGYVWQGRFIDFLCMVLSVVSFGLLLIPDTFASPVTLELIRDIFSVIGIVIIAVVPTWARMIVSGNLYKEYKTDENYTHLNGLANTHIKKSIKNDLKKDKKKTKHVDLNDFDLQLEQFN